MLFRNFTNKLNKLPNFRIRKNSSSRGAFLASFYRGSPRAIASFGVVFSLCQPMAIAQTTTDGSTQLLNRAESSYTDPANPTTPINSISNLIKVDPSNRLVDPLGRIIGCDGEAFDSYEGFTVALYEATGVTGSDLGPLVALPDPSSADVIILGARNVNVNNINPFPLGLTDGLDPSARGQFNFLLTPAQVTPGSAYILVIQPPQEAFLDARRIRISITAFDNDNLSYVATSLDGLPLGIDDTVPVGKQLTVDQGQTTAVVVFAFPSNANIPVCQSQSIRIEKTADRVTTEPGGFVVYRLSVTNLSTTTINNVEISDRLPLGFTLLEDSVQATIGDQPTNLTTTTNGRNITFRFNEGLPGGTPPSNNPLAKIVYATEVTPDAIRGDGRNFALASGGRADSNFVVNDGPVVFRVNVREGLISDLGTLIGRVFVDKNFDGEQQYGEPGVPNAVVFLQNGNRIVTDKDGLFSVANVLPGWHVGVLDLTSVPGYTMAPNPYVLRSETQGREARLEPGGLARMNFAVTPVAEDLTKDQGEKPTGGDK